MSITSGEAYRCVRWLLGVAGKSMIDLMKRNSKYRIYSHIEFEDRITDMCQYEEVTNACGYLIGYDYDEVDIWNNVFMREKVLREAIDQKNIKSLGEMQYQTEVYYDQLGWRAFDRHFNSNFDRKRNFNEKETYKGEEFEERDIYINEYEFGFWLEEENFLDALEDEKNKE